MPLYFKMWPYINRVNNWGKEGYIYKLLTKPGHFWMWKLTRGLSVEGKHHKQCPREVKLHTNPRPSGSSFWEAGREAAARLFQTHSLCSAPVLPLLSAPGHWPRRKSLISSCALRVEGEFSQRGAPAGDGKGMESLLWFCSLRSAAEKMTQLPGIQFSCPFLLSVLITLNFAGAISTGASSMGCHQPRVHVPPLGLSPVSHLQLCSQSFWE